MTFRAAFYKSTPAGFHGIYNRAVRWWTHSPYSHCELVFADGVCGSASFMDGGVRFKAIDLNPDHWDIVELPAALEPAARAWFQEHAGQPYDLPGNLHFLIGAVADDKGKWFCSESIAAALGFPEPWRYDPGVLASTLFHMAAFGRFFIAHP